MEIPEPLSHCFARTLQIKTSAGLSGSSFIMNHWESQWLVTAKHIVGDLGHRDVQVYDQTGQQLPGLGARLPTMANDHETVAIFRFSTKHPDFEKPLEPYVADDVFATQDAYFLGFPDLGDGLAYLHPTTPIIKKATVSGQAADKDDNVVWLLDGMASGGFSGGPVIIHEQEPEGYRVLGVTSSYVPAYVLVTARRPSQLGAALPAPNGPFVKTNMGLMIVFDIQLAIDAINQSLGGRPPE
jgi:hypothetical protein